MHSVANTTWDCRQAKAEIALKAGGDAIDPLAGELLESHLDDCSHCRRYFAEMTASLESLQVCAAESPRPALSRSLWPGIAAQLPRTASLTASARFNFWVPTAAMAAACAAMILVAIVQIERSIPYEPMVTPQVRTVIGVQPQYIFNGAPSDEMSLRRPYESTAPKSLPVQFKHSLPEQEW